MVMKQILEHFRPALLMLLALTVITGGLYPALVSGLAQTLFARQAAGSLISRQGQVAGSELIGQPFSAAGYFWGRPSATTPQPYNASASGGSNQAPTNPELLEAVKARVAALKAADPTAGGPVPVDLVTASASGLDPHLSPAAALYQASRVARARGLSLETVQALVRAHIEGRQWGVLGEPRVNVLRLNLALDELAQPKAEPK
jgi:K+-transporting ATPase ATPase C chain